MNDHSKRIIEIANSIISDEHSLVSIHANNFLNQDIDCNDLPDIFRGIATKHLHRQAEEFGLDIQDQKNMLDLMTLALINVFGFTLFESIGHVLDGKQ
jgi:hypothetical protein